MWSPPPDDDAIRRADDPAGGFRHGRHRPGHVSPQHPAPSFPFPGVPHRPPGQGPYHSAAGRSGYSPPPYWPVTGAPQPGQTGQVPPFGVPPAGGPGAPWPPPGASGHGQPPHRRRSHSGLLVTLVAGLVVLAAVGAALVVAVGRGDGRSASADLSVSPSVGAGDPTGSGTPSGERTAELLAVVPLDFTDCTAAELAGDGDVAAVDCGASADQPGPAAAEFHLYDDTATLDEVFARHAAEVDPMPQGETCSTAEGVTAWRAAGVEGGEVACTITDDGLLITWTDREFGIEGAVTAPGTTQEELAVLTEWWRAKSDFRG
jgi:hypothetical protein